MLFLIFFQALQEFQSQLESLDPSDPNSVKPLLPFWPRIYAKIAADHDRRVREAAQKANLAGRTTSAVLCRSMAFLQYPSCCSRVTFLSLQLTSYTLRKIMLNVISLEGRLGV